MNKSKQSKKNILKNVYKTQKIKEHEDYDYDFIPTLNEWVNIDEQREKTKELEDI